MENINIKIGNFIGFVLSLYKQLGKSPSEELSKFLGSGSLNIIASLKVLIKTHNIKSDKELYEHLKAKLNVTERELNKLSLADTDKLLRYTSYFYDISKIL